MLSGIGFNLFLLGYYKYWDFFLTTTNEVLGTHFPLLDLLLPLAISFYSFQQIAYLVDCYHGEVREANFLNYALFITFFPQLIAGPIVHHKEMMPQFDHNENRFFNYENQAKGLFIFSIGLFKKVVLADTFAKWSTQGFNQSQDLSFIDGWVTALSFIFQLYFDFSGYMDMAMGTALFFNIKLPVNFNSPYKALNIQEFWNTWHMTLGRFLYRYVYIPFNKSLLNRVFIPLGLQKYVKLRTHLSLFFVFLVSGIWHGAGWTFVIFGVLHGTAVVGYRLWRNTGLRLPAFMAWGLTFGFVVLSSVFFRASSVAEALRIVAAICGLNGVVFPARLEGLLSELPFIAFQDLVIVSVSESTIFLLIGFLIILCCKNSIQLTERFRPNLLYFIYCVFLLLTSLLNLTKASEFLYFNF